MPTLPLYQRDETLRKYSTTAALVQPLTALSEANRTLFKQAEPSSIVVVTTETIFYPQGGGQPYDVGTMRSLASGAEFKVTAVRNGEGEMKGEILHLGSFSSAGSTFDSGETVEQEIDDARRTLHSRVHTGGHVVALAVRKHLDATAVPDVIELGASHAPESAFVNFQGTIDGDHKNAVQAQVDAFLAAKLPVRVHFWTEQELRARCAAVPTGVVMPEEGSEGLIRAVDIEGAGAYPCGGTHVKDTGLVGKVVVKKISRSKGNSRVSYIVE